MGARVLAAIPWRDRHDLTGPLVARLADDPDVVTVGYSLGPTDPATIAWERTAPLAAVFRWGPVPDVSLYRTWNHARRVADRTGLLLALLNNDVTLPPRAVGTLGAILDDAPEDVWAVHPTTDRSPTAPVDPTRLSVTRGLWPSGLTPFAFVMRPDVDVPPVDERFRFYCGDVQLLWEAQRAGYRTVRADGIGVAHRLGATRKDARHRGWVKATVAADRTLRERLYPSGVPV